MNNPMRAIPALLLFLIVHCGGLLASQGDDADATVADSPAPDSQPNDSGNVNLFDLGVPDIKIADVSLPVCYNCLTSKCALELAMCEVDSTCESLATCALQTCPSNFTTNPTCLLDCGLLASSTPPLELIAIAGCLQASCSTKCL
jgi:hypothetical protein